MLTNTRAKGVIFAVAFSEVKSVSFENASQNRKFEGYKSLRIRRPGCRL
jgi:hypothetical protein